MTLKLTCLLFLVDQVRNITFDLALTKISNTIFIELSRKKFVRNCQIRHTYGEEDDDDMDINEQDAVRLTEQAIASGTTQAAPICEQPAAAPREAEVMIGGKSCKWCGSTSHLRKSHKDCPFNDKKKNQQQIRFLNSMSGKTLQ